MKKLVALAMVAGFAWAQTPSDYLGITLGQTAVLQGGWVEWNGTDSVMVSTLDTQSVADTFTYNGYSALSIWNAEHATGDSLYDTTWADTVWNNAPWLMSRAHITDTISRDAYSVRTPFTQGDRWSTGLEGVYFDDFDDDGLGDSMEIVSDTIFVEDTESLNVPAGTFFTWRMRQESHARLFYVSNVLVDSGIIDIVAYRWWSPGNWGVKDTSHIDMVIYIYGTPMSVSRDAWDELISLVDVNEKLSSPEPVRLLSPNPTRGLLRVSRPPEGRVRVALYDPAGRKAMEATSDRGDDVALDISGLARGVYFLRVKTGARVALSETVIKR